MAEPDPSIIDATLQSRAVTFENPTGAKGAGGTAHGGRKGAPWRMVPAGARVVLADLDGPGVLRHWWLTVPAGPPERMRAYAIEVFYDHAPEPSVSVPCLDFFGMPHGRPVAFCSAVASTHEGRGFNFYAPMPFREHVRVELVNHSDRAISQLYYQIDFTLGPVDAQAGVLHATFRRENPTTMQRDFVIAEGLRGPGRFLGCNVGVRVLDDGWWYGEGEVKMYLDGDDEHPTICGTGLEDYVGTAWGMGPHHAWYAGAPLEVKAPTAKVQPDLLAFYRWHLPDPVVFLEDLRVTIQQIGMALFFAGDEADFEEYARTHPAAGRGWVREPNPAVTAMGIAERVDDYCATAFVYCREPQAVPRLDVAAATAEVERLPYESAQPLEGLLDSVG